MDAARAAADDGNEEVLGVDIGASPVEGRLLVDPIDGAGSGDTDDPDGEPGLTPEEAATDGVGLPGGDGDDDGDHRRLPAVFRANANRWYVPDSDTHDWAVRTRDGGRRYYKTLDGAAERLRREYQ
jgi:polyphosphate kinase